MFRATKCSSSGESIVSIRPPVYVGDRVVYRFRWNCFEILSLCRIVVHPCGVEILEISAFSVADVLIFC